MEAIQTLSNKHNFSTALHFDRFRNQLRQDEFQAHCSVRPPSQVNRQNYFLELQSQKPANNSPWIVLGDFNQTLQASDRSNLTRGPNRSFIALIVTLQLIDLPLQGRRYTWSRGSDNPTCVRFDRVLISNEWSTKFPNTSQRALQSTLSDHCPLQCTIQTTFPLPNTFHFENYWLQMGTFKELVIATWTEMEPALTPSQLAHKLQTLRRKIKQWAKTAVGDTDTQMEVCNQTLFWLTKVEEARSLTDLERLVRQIMTDRLMQIESLRETK